MSQLGGGSFASGAASGAFNQLVMNELAKIGDPALMQWASAVLGAAAAKVAGGNAQIGASVAASQTKNNFLYHEQYAEYQKQLEDLDEKRKNGSITQKEYDKAVEEVNTYWAAEDRKNEEKLKKDGFKNLTGITQFGVTMSGKPNFIDPAGVEAHSSRYTFDWKSIWDSTIDLGKSILSNPITEHPILFIGGTIISAGMDIQDFTNPFGLSKGSSKAESVIWKGFSNGKLKSHYEKHVVEGNEFGNISQSEYLKKAKEFATESSSNFQEAKVGNFNVKYDPETRRVFVGHEKSREIRTFYKADSRDVDPFQAAIKLAKELSGK